MAANWTDLVYKLSDLLQEPLASIEILPGGLKEWESAQLPPESPKPNLNFPFVFVEGNLGIPKKVLCALYMAVASSPWRNSEAKDANAASIVILLLNPAHETALNTRKQLIQDGFLDPQRELVLIELIARGSPECAKQSSVWDHRRWCFRKICGIMGPAVIRPFQRCWSSSEEVQMFPKISPSAVRHELNVIHRTCEIYPRNYHSWTHLHFLMDVCYASIYLSGDLDDRRQFLGIITGEHIHLRRWVEQHVSDYSAVHQLCQLQRLIDHLRMTSVFDDDAMRASNSSELVEHAISLILAFPSHESLWMYLRDTLDRSTDEDREKIIEEVQSDKFPSSPLRRRLLDWFSREKGRKNKE
ncbi:hypothetical protein CPB84DRAFT_1812322 [Gymnopilus junonius]|uniref:Protein prenyltransferase alpha subunit repeat-containing protein 1 n=1 Tax=Gymnopilus junonius TaxID=109634 RepID=A0A9P5NWA9_GYMJU|nr:hypothetical protein CPB84DRAFT_1812322 [Gymnopilus junonius]